MYNQKKNIMSATGRNTEAAIKSLNKINYGPCSNFQSLSVIPPQKLPFVKASALKHANDCPFTLSSLLYSTFKRLHLCMLSSHHYDQKILENTNLPCKYPVQNFVPCRKMELNPRVAGQAMKPLAAKVKQSKIIPTRSILILLNCSHLFSW